LSISWQFLIELSKALSKIRNDYFTELRKMLLLLLLEYAVTYALHEDNKPS